MMNTFLPTPMSTGPKSVSVLLTEAYALVRHLVQPIVAGAVLFGIISALIGGSMVVGAIGSIGFDRFEQQMQQFEQRMEEINQRLEAGDTAALDDIQIPEAELADVTATIWSAMPAVIGGSLLLLLVAFVSRAFVIVVLVRKLADPMQAFNGFGKHVVPLVLLWIWLFLRSFVWIPLVGWIVAIVLAPRFIAAPLYLLEEGKGVRESVRLSMRVTIGAWGRIVLPCLAAALIAMVVSAILDSILGDAGMILGIILAVANELLSAYVMATGIIVARDVLAHPTAKVVNA